jgi:hypothetical protein
MSAESILTVATVAGLTLILHRKDGTTRATLQVPEGKAPAGASATERIAAFFHACDRDRVRVEPRGGRSTPPVLWVANAAIDIDDATAATVEAWLASRSQPQATATDTAVPA